MRLELWLDESGDFVSDVNTRLNPSLVGGVLIPVGIIDEGIARKMLGKPYVHFTDEPADYTLNILKGIQEKNGSFVVFQNQERVQIIDSDTTYLNVLAEGIIQLLLQLAAVYRRFELSIMVATRKNTNSGYGIISPEQYEKRLRERVIVALARKSLTSKWKYTIKFDDARTSSRLMLADGVCNTYLTRTSSKFTDSDREVIKSMYKQEYIFSFFENSVEKELHKLLGEGNITDALYEIYNNKELQNREYYLDVVLKRLEQLDDHSRGIQLSGISTKFDTLIKIDRKYEYVKPVLKMMQDELFLLLDKYCISSSEFKLDIILYLYTIYTHEGSVDGDIQDKLAQEQLQHIKDIMVKLKYFNMYKIRRGIHEKNMLNVFGSIDSLTKGIDVLEETMEMISLLDEDEALAEAKYEYLGKNYGTRGQGYTMLIHEDPDYLALAIKDFDRALSHFTLDKDIDRQYTYKTMAYCEGKQFANALQCLFKSCHLEFNGENFGELFDYLKAQDITKVIFKYLYYIKIMAFSKEDGQEKLADNMFQALNNAHVTVESLQKSQESPHPIQFIFWFMGSYSARRGKQKLGLKYLDDGIEICNSLTFENITLKLIQLGMYAEKALIHERYKKDVIDFYKKITENCGQSSILKYIIYLEGLTEVKLTEQYLKKIVQVTRCIN
ncbi:MULTISPECIES: hypothetical protein [unclassified Mesobacillus]|uniref:hypothetical protein n=1 Tax=unclassified Mesobacillus TaxID=2675270 RepID=UPI00203FEEE8|nr:MULTISPECIES: hypothetical protein [unclassified Mesobacillus]MCM3124415.1 hypothetical protein [Mesobacillus sp. MER 33]MCM3234875.1 hypothetical protein [Mesobacillus sp. MER 48]